MGWRFLALQVSAATAVWVVAATAALTCSCSARWWTASLKKVRARVAYTPPSLSHTELHTPSDLRLFLCNTLHRPSRRIKEQIVLQFKVIRQNHRISPKREKQQGRGYKQHITYKFKQMSYQKWLRDNYVCIVKLKKVNVRRLTISHLVCVCARRV